MSIEISESEVVAAMCNLPQGHGIDWLGGEVVGCVTFDRRDGVALRAYKKPHAPWEDALYSGCLSPASSVGFDSPGYPAKEDVTLTELVAWLASWDGSEVDVGELLAQAPEPEPAVRFPWTVARSKSVDRFVARLGTSWARAALAALYLARGEYPPPLAKIGGPTATTGVTFGFCDEEGTHKPLSESPTHAGWRFDEDPEERP